MRRLSTTEVELTPTESQAYDRWEHFIALGHSYPSAADLVRKEFQVSDSFITWLMY